MIFLRSLAFTLALGLVTPPFSLIALASFPLPAQARWRIISGWAHIILWLSRVLTGISYRVEGLEHLPREPAIILSKHQSAWETIAFQLIFPPQVQVLKRELLWIPFFGWGLALMSPIAINRSRGSGALKRMAARGAQRIAQGFWILIFPEGTRTTPGKRSKYHVGGAWVACRLGVPVVPVAHNAGLYWGKNEFMKRPGEIRVQIGEPIYPAGLKPEALNAKAEEWIEAQDGRAVPGLTQPQRQLQFDAEPSRAVAGTAQRVVLSERVLHYRFVRARRRTIGIVVRRGEVEARAPRHVALAEVESFIRKKERWIAKRLAESTCEPPPFRWAEGEALPVLGQAARLTASPGATMVHLTDDRLALPPAAFARWRELTIAWLRAAALDLFRERVRHYANSLGLREPSLGLSNARTQWGSCRRTRGGAGRVLINWRLVHLPPHLTDYVVAHELAHLREPNHSPRFWAIVAQLFPDYLSARRELARLGRALPTL